MSSARSRSRPPAPWSCAPTSAPCSPPATRPPPPDRRPGTPYGRPGPGLRLAQDLAVHLDDLPRFGVQVHALAERPPVGALAADEDLLQAVGEIPHESLSGGRRAPRLGPRHHGGWSDVLEYARDIADVGADHGQVGEDGL